MTTVLHLAMVRDQDTARDPAMVPPEVVTTVQDMGTVLQQGAGMPRVPAMVLVTPPLAVATALVTVAGRGAVKVRAMAVVMDPDTVDRATAPSMARILTERILRRVGASIR